MHRSKSLKLLSKVLTAVTLLSFFSAASFAELSSRTATLSTVRLSLWYSGLNPLKVHTRMPEVVSKSTTIKRSIEELEHALNIFKRKSLTR